MKVLCVIPARYASTRLPGKPLADICGKPMICRVYDRAKLAKRVEKTVVATDDERVKRAVEEDGGEAVMTRKDHNSGTDRLAEAVAGYPDMNLVINVQGDEPLIEPNVIDRLAAAFDDDEDLMMATVKARMDDEEDMRNPNNVKVVTDKDGYALYFSRSLMPYPREDTDCPVYKHIGIYAYRRDFLLKYAKMPQTMLEKTESLEQLRALENGFRIKVIESDANFVGVDTAEDLSRVNEIYGKMLGS
ncbi:MAG: 3-deoxy-manno-octulosonate cytidylyltransferase [Veillonellaceae bacterium]|nr:3-deoxy-manno-octulosonate cytidylyltransferase [Veillonellaceae bacterium]